jgi:predicted phosphoribosyltransferase
VVDPHLARLGRVDATALDLLRADARAEIERRVQTYRGGRPPPDVDGRVVVLIDDGLATGRTAEAAIAALRTAGASRVVLAVPVASPDTADALAGKADDVVTVIRPRDMRAVGLWYDDFTQTSDAEVVALLTTTSA